VSSLAGRDETALPSTRRKHPRDVLLVLEADPDR